MKIKPGSFGAVKFYNPYGKLIHTVFLVDSIDERHVYCTHAAVSIDGSPFRDIKQLLKSHGKEELVDTTLVTTDEFDAIFDLNIIPLNKFKNL